MGLKILHSADWHLDSPFASFPEPQRQNLKEAQRRIPVMTADLCAREGCDLVLLAGDIFDGKPNPQTLSELKRALGDCGVPVFIAPGNHDCLTPDSPWQQELWPENVYIFARPEMVVLEKMDCRVYGAGYEAMDCPGLLEDFQTEGTEKYHIMVLHGDPLSANSPYCPVTAAQVRESGLTVLALGHIHKAGAFRAGETLCTWPGCPMGRGWDETGEKGVNLITLEDTVTHRLIPLDLPRFYEHTVDIGSGAVSALEQVLPAVGNEHFYRILLRGSGEVDLNALKAEFSRFPNLELRDATRERVDLWADAGEDSLRGMYFRLLQEQSHDPHAVLAAEISKKLLSGEEVALP